MIGWCETVFYDGQVFFVRRNVFSCNYDLHTGTSGIGDAILDFIEWFHSKDFGKK